MRTAVLLVLILTVLAPSGRAINYCSISQRHTMCRFTSPNWHQCAQVMSTGLEEEHKLQLLHLHNQLRSRVAVGSDRQVAGMPTAANMMKMSWSDDLAEVAQRWIEQCRFEHDCSECRQIDQSTMVGQNLYMSMISGPSQSDGSGSEAAKTREAIEGAVLSWYDEIRFMASSYFHSFPMHTPNTIGHFTALVWGVTSQIGCGYIRYRKGSTTHRSVGCNYRPGGNLVGSPIYLAGSPCSRCPAGTTCSEEYPGLCTHSGRYGSYRKQQQKRPQHQEPSRSSYRPQRQPQQHQQQRPYSAPQSSGGFPLDLWSPNQPTSPAPQRPHMITLPDSMPESRPQCPKSKVYVIQVERISNCFTLFDFIFCRKDENTWLATSVNSC